MSLWDIFACCSSTVSIPSNDEILNIADNLYRQINGTSVPESSEIKNLKKIANQLLSSISEGGRPPSSVKISPLSIEQRIELHKKIITVQNKLVKNNCPKKIDKKRIKTFSKTLIGLRNSLSTLETLFREHKERGLAERHRRDLEDFIRKVDDTISPYFSGHGVVVEALIDSLLEENALFLLTRMWDYNEEIPLKIKELHRFEKAREMDEDYQVMFGIPRFEENQSSNMTPDSSSSSTSTAHKYPSLSSSSPTLSAKGTPSPDTSPSIVRRISFSVTNPLPFPFPSDIDLQNSSLAALNLQPLDLVVHTITSTEMPISRIPPKIVIPGSPVSGMTPLTPLVFPPKGSPSHSNPIEDCAPLGNTPSHLNQIPTPSSVRKDMLLGFK